MYKEAYSAKTLEAIELVFNFHKQVASSENKM